MRLRTLFIILVLMLAACGAVLFRISATTGDGVFYVAEGLLLVSVVFSIYFYNKVLKTINAIANGLELLKEQDFSSRLAPVGQHDADRAVEVFNRMISELKTERLRLREQNHFLDLIIQSSPMGVVIMDFNGVITSVNESGVKFLGYTTPDEVVGGTMERLSSPLASRLGSVEQGETRTLRIGDAMIYRCSRLSFIDRGFHHPFILIESLTSEVMKAEKKAYEKVIRMIAHEVNNSVAGVTSAIDSVASELDSLPELKEIMQVCVERCYSMSGFITRFADVVKIPEPILHVEDLNDCVTRCKVFMENMCRERDIRLAVELSEEPVKVNIDSGLVEHVLVNIIKNSAESISSCGDITISTSAPATLVVTDNGKGIDSEVDASLFTPFFSTKPNGQGLGLIFIREVLMKHNCTFSLRTYEDGLTRFKIQFPVIPVR